MTTGHFNPDESMRNRANTEEGQHFETDDVNARALIKVGLIFAVVVTALVGAAWVLQIILTGKLPNLQPPNGGLAVIPVVTPAAEPRLQPNPMQDLQAWRAAEDHVLHSYGWVDQNAGVVRIPIERAMDLVVARGLPTRPLTETQSFNDHGQALPSVSSSGRTLERRIP